MSDRGASKSVVLNWRGLLLSAGIFAAVFAILLLMAHQNESKTSDMGSSLREDPYGTSLMFDSYGRAGYQVKRGQHEDSLADQDASKTTAFFIGGYSPNDWITNSGKVQTGTKFRGRLERFLASGGRIVLVEPSWEIKSESQGWEVGNKWDKDTQKHTLPRVLPDPSAMPADSEAMFLGTDAPWLQTDGQWTALYRGGVGADAAGETPARVYLATRQVGNGELVAASQEFFLLNEAIKTHPNPVLLDFLAGGRPVIWVDETLHGLRQSEGVLWLVQRYRLETALLLFWGTLLALLWNMSGDLVRRPASNPSTQIVRNAEAAGVAGRRLLQRSIAKDRVLAECWEQFRRCWPQDARAISEDPLSGERLSAALKKPPLEGYKEMSELILERRAFARGLASVRREATSRSRFDR